MAGDDVNGAQVKLLSDEEVGAKFGCAAGPDAACGNYLKCARIAEALAGGFNVESGADSGNEQLRVADEHNHDGKMG